MRGRLLTVVAVGLIVLGSWIALGGADALVAQRAPAPTTTPAGFATSRPPTSTYGPSSASPTAKPVRAIPAGYRVKVPRLGIDLPILEGDVTRDTVVQQTPEDAAFHLPGTAIPGDGSNSYVYAHARSGMFLSLWDAKVGDEVLVTTPDGRSLRYVVSEVHPRIPPNETKWVLPTPTERLTLQTSTGPNPEDPRFVVVAIPAS